MEIGNWYMVVSSWAIYIIYIYIIYIIIYIYIYIHIIYIRIIYTYAIYIYIYTEILNWKLHFLCGISFTETSKFPLNDSNELYFSSLKSNIWRNYSWKRYLETLPLNLLLYEITSITILILSCFVWVKSVFIVVE